MLFTRQDPRLCSRCSSRGVSNGARRVLIGAGPQPGAFSQHATGESIPLRGSEGVPGLPGEPQDEAGLTGKFVKVFSNESIPCIRWPKYWSFSISISNE